MFTHRKNKKVLPSKESKQLMCSLLEKLSYTLFFPFYYIFIRVCTVLYFIRHIALLLSQARVGKAQVTVIKSLYQTY